MVQFIVHDLDGVTDDFSFSVVCDCHWLSFRHSGNSGLGTGMTRVFSELVTRAGLDLAKQAESLVGDLLGGRVQVDEDIEVPIGDVGWDVAGTTEALTLVVVGSDARRIHAVDRWCAARQESGRGHLGACVDKSGRGHVPSLPRMTLATMLDTSTA